MTVKIISYGGGVQSNALLVLAAQKKIDYRTFVFANVGEDSEHPSVFAYIQNVAIPYAEQNGLELIEVKKTRRTGETETILERLYRTEKSIPIPVRMSNGKPVRRICTVDFKINPVAKWCKQAGATKADPAIIGLGISTDEIRRMRNDSQHSHTSLAYPLIDLGLSREDCKQIIIDAGLPLPGKSSCYFCPFHSRKEWQRLHDEEPDLFQKSVELEQFILEKRKRHGKDTVYLHNSCKPLSEAVQPNMIAEKNILDVDFCESGFCEVA